MLWAALLPAPHGVPPAPAEAQALAAWALQFTPRVALVDEAVLLELGASVRLFGGARALHQRLLRQGREFGLRRLAWAESGLGALAVLRGAPGDAAARAACADGGDRPVPQRLQLRLDALALDTLSAARAHAELLRQLGCRSLGDVRRLPRAGLARRCGSGVLEALDIAYGLRAETYPWVTLPERFVAGIELPARVQSADALVFGARRLLLQLCAWLAARQAGVCALRLRWHLDAPRAAGVEWGELMLRTAQGMRDADHLGRLLAEHLARVRLPAPVDALELQADEVQALHGRSASLLPQPSEQQRALDLALERIAARLGEQQVLRGVLLDDHRPEWAQRWQPHALAVPAVSRARQQGAPPDTARPQPGFLLAEPQPLGWRDGAPWQQGPVQLLLGPQRIQAGWWDRHGDASAHVARDYWLARASTGRLLWVFRGLGGDDDDARGSRWFVHGWFA